MVLLLPQKFKSFDKYLLDDTSIIDSCGSQVRHVIHDSICGDQTQHIWFLESCGNLCFCYSISSGDEDMEIPRQ